MKDDWDEVGELKEEAMRIQRGHVVQRQRHSPQTRGVGGSNPPMPTIADRIKGLNELIAKIEKAHKEAANSKLRFGNTPP